MIAADCLVGPPQERFEDAAGYMSAMHEMCIVCHQQKVAESPQEYDPEFAECANCHRDVDGTRIYEMKPYSIGRREQ